MRRFKDYLRFAAWQSGLSYIALWALTIWALDWGPSVFLGSGACRVDSATVLFYWICDASSPFAILAAVANTALTLAVWAPVYVAAAIVQPNALALAVPIIATHVIGLPTAILVMTRLMVKVFAALRRAHGYLVGRRDAAVPAPAIAAETADAVGRAKALPRVAAPRAPARQIFGLRGAPQS